MDQNGTLRCQASATNTAFKVTGAATASMNNSPRTIGTWYPVVNGYYSRAATLYRMEYRDPSGNISYIQDNQNGTVTAFSYGFKGPTTVNGTLYPDVTPQGILRHPLDIVREPQSNPGKCVAAAILMGCVGMLDIILAAADIVLEFGSAGLFTPIIIGEAALVAAANVAVLVFAVSACG